MADNAVTQAGFWGKHMKIEPPANPLSGVGAGKATTDRATSGAVSADTNAATTANVGGGASVSTSALSSEMRALQEALAQTGTADIDVAKVASIKAAIANGQLVIDTSKIADGLIATARDLLSAQSK
ncbi:flagellar biosynthesis anti-sigma factor FlgM [Pandoraea captiosa]|jgi:negative regulator of flagellin synthesis FlgM|uniref:Negative regulator of flagellin synthesis n=2 Tax=Pandoraea captiosa TaxID=2508302 RepID=A0A5E5ABP0_9BURK|nr:flagellar biosynthesis anti-sigma factor FlgM [Pandoraea captiosa]